MKNHTKILVILLAILCCACEEKSVGGDWDFHDAYVLDGENLVEAHNYTLELPAQQCTVDLQIVSQGIYRQTSIDTDHFGQNLPHAFSLTLLTPRDEAEVYDYIVDSCGVVHKEWPRYLQTLRISAKQNTFILPRIMRFHIWSESPRVGAAAVTIRQAGER